MPPGLSDTSIPRYSRRDVTPHPRRDEILDAATRVFTVKGFNAASIREIAVEAGMSHTGVLHHFPDKAVLLETLLERRGQRAAAEVGLDFSTGLSYLRGLLALAARDVEKPEGVLMFSIVSAEALAPTHPAHASIARWYEFLRSTALDALTDLQERGLYARADVPLELAAIQIAGLRAGLTQQWLLASNVDAVGAFRVQLQSYVTERL
ncbi:TetR/AcrR family transcriptional regulator [Pseudoclavibacter sp. RFBA6]|uniref:TetR/AcrR family transcriptional regulator n=1 Tax=Pseudoclavibacter sp. RFBA6 TaxID=2080573 RepID=UPI000CE7F196|nr:TetR/AcrR family transcriptional regulator [Pseudoclavibacter sp. RFBA6]PPG37468.1 TetR/AcrR family transcriptional regulator [Pseudoclavibacter sp. RFBA6]